MESSVFFTKIMRKIFFKREGGELGNNIYGHYEQNHSTIFRSNDCFHPYFFKFLAGIAEFETALYTHPEIKIFDVTELEPSNKEIQLSLEEFYQQRFFYYENLGVKDKGKFERKSHLAVSKNIYNFILKSSSDTVIDHRKAQGPLAMQLEIAHEIAEKKGYDITSPQILKVLSTNVLDHIYPKITKSDHRIFHNFYCRKK